MLPEQMTAQTDQRPPPIKFERKAVSMPNVKEGGYVPVDVDYVHVKSPGCLDIYINKVPQWLAIQKSEVDRGRIPQKWLDDYKDAYQRWQNGQEMPLHGMPIRGWSVISPAQQEMLININVLTVEDLAVMNDEGVKRIGMGAGELKQKAVTALRASKDIGPVVMEIADLKKRLDLSEANNKALIEQTTALLAELKMRGGVANEPVQTTTITSDDLLDAPVKRGPGRPRNAA